VQRPTEKEPPVKSMDTRKRKTILCFGVIGLIIATCLATAGSLQPMVDAKVVKVACVGDSITEYGGYPFKLQLMLGGNYDVANFGVSGSTVSIDGNIAYMEQPAFLAAMDFEPELVLIMLGTNDANLETTNDTDIRSDYIQLLNAFRSLQSTPDIIVVASPPIYSDYSGYNNTHLVTNVIPTIESVADELNLTIVDMYTAMDDQDYFKDGIHPNDEGTTVIASTLYDAVVKYYMQS
jgi:acyl-CoA thioesterase-1